MSADGAPTTGPDLRDRVRQARETDRARLEAEAEAAMQTVASVMTRSGEHMLSAWTTFLRESLSATARRAGEETIRTTEAAGKTARQEMNATAAAATQQITGTTVAATAQVEDAARRAIATLNRLERESERIGRASRSLARWPLILAAAAAVAILATAIWARMAILPDTSTVTRPDGSTVTVLRDPDWIACPEGLCRTTTATTTGG